MRLPGSKSLTNRYLVLAALAESESIVRGWLRSRDTELMVAALRQLGATIVEDEDARAVDVTGFREWPPETPPAHPPLHLVRGSATDWSSLSLPEIEERFQEGRERAAREAGWC